MYNKKNYICLTLIIIYYHDLHTNNITWIKRMAWLQSAGRSPATLQGHLGVEERVQSWRCRNGYGKYWKILENIGKYWKIIKKWRCPKMGIARFILRVNGIFHYKPSIFWYPHDSNPRKYLHGVLSVSRLIYPGHLISQLCCCWNHAPFEGPGGRQHAAIVGGLGPQGGSIGRAHFG